MGIVGSLGFSWIGYAGRCMGCGITVFLKLGLALCLAHDGDIFGAIVVSVLSPALFLIAAGPKSR